MTEIRFDGAKVAVLGGETGQNQLNEIRNRLESSGASVTVVPSDVPFERAHPSGFAGLIVPDVAIADGKAAQVVREFMVADKPVAAIGIGVRLLVLADAVAGRSVASADEIAGDVKGGGGQLSDTSIRVDEKLVTARSGEDLRSFMERVVRTFAAQLEERQIDQVSEQSFPASDPPPGPGAIGAARTGRRESTSDASDKSGPN